MFLSICIAPFRVKHQKDPVFLYCSEDDSHYDIAIADHSIHARIKKRSAYPRTYCHQLSSQSVQFGYGQPGSINTEYLTITLHATGELVIERDAFATLPLFYGKTQDIFIIANAYEAVVDALPATHVCHNQLLNILANRSTDIHNRTLLHEIRILAERETLQYSLQGLSIISPPDRSWGKTAEAPATTAEDFRRIFDDCLDHFVTTRLMGERFAFETSGGLDSSILPLYMHRHGQCPQNVPMTAVMVKGFGNSQRLKLEALQQTIGSTLVTTPLNMQSDHPLRIFLRTPQPFYNYQGLYESAFERLAKELNERGIQVLCRGFGGDDIFEHCNSLEQEFGYGQIEQSMRQQYDLPPFLTPSFRQAYAASTPSRPTYTIPFRPLSIVKTAACVNNTFIKYDIWPIAPYADSRLYAYCQGLPLHFRRKKQILRAYCQAYQFPSIIYDGPNEHFNTFFYTCWQAGIYERAFTRLLQNAFTVRYGYVAPDHLRNTYQEVLAGTRSKWLFELYCWLAIESNLQHTANIQMPNFKAYGYDHR